MLKDENFIGLKYLHRFGWEVLMHLTYMESLTWVLSFWFRSGTHGLNEELGRHSTRNSSKACFFFCECECESVEHVLSECTEYRSIRKEFIRNLNGILQNNFHLKSSFNKTKYIFDQSIFDFWLSNTEAFYVQRMEFAQGETLSFRFIWFSFSQLYQSMLGQWQRCYGSAFMR